MKSPLRLRRVDEPLATALSTSDQRTVARWAADCAEHVLPLFERSRPDDERPRQAIEAARAWARGEIRVGAARAAALAAHALAVASYAVNAAEYAARAGERDWQSTHLTEM